MKNLARMAVYLSCLFLLILSIFAFLFPVYKPPLEGELTVKWSRPSGIQFNDLREGDRLEIWFRSDADVGIYLITHEQADEFRSPSYYKDPLPEPLITDIEGDVEITIEKDGDFEILFWNESFTRDHRIEYRIDSRLSRDLTISLVSGSSLLLLAAVPIVIWVLIKKREGSKPPVGDRFK
jgi:hypothetical protein